MLRLSFFYANALLFILAFLAVFSPANAAPSSVTRSTVVRRADAPYSGPSSFQTVTTTDTAAGLITQTCQVKLTPIQVDGKNMVKEEKTCKVTLGGSAPPSSGSSNKSPGGNNGNTLTNTLTSTVAPSAVPTPSPKAQTSAPPSKPTTQSPPPSQSSSSSSSSASASASASGGTSTSSSGSQPSSTSQPATSATSAPDTNSASPAPSGTAAAATTTDAAFQIPGKKLAVLPIGLGVFAGISVIALIVVGLVTYERTKHRKAFRQRKLAEMGQTMGYSGTAGARV